MYDIAAYTIPLNGVDLFRVLKAWKWLTGENKTVVALTKLGDLLLKDEQGRLLLLDSGKGSLQIIDENHSNFINGKLSNNTYEEILLSFLIDKLQNAGKTLMPDQVYSFYKLPVIGGRYIVENIYPHDLYEHFEVTGELHLQIKDLPEGTSMEFEIGP